MLSRYREDIARIRTGGGSLAERLEHAGAACASHLPDYSAALDRFVARLVAAESGAAAPAPGEPMPDFMLPDAAGRIWRLDALRAAGPVVIAHQRGDWCSFCRIALDALGEAVPAIRAAGGSVVAIAPQRARHAARQAAEVRADYPILSDPGSGYATLVGLTVPAGAELLDHLAGFGIDLAEICGAADGLLPIPATFVVAPDGRVLARHIDPDPRRRMEPAAILQALAAARCARP